jgi:hypothetical protein
MILDFAYRYFSKTIFIIAAFGMTVAFLQLIGRFVGYDLAGQWYSAGRLVELSAALLAFVIAVLLRQIRDELRTRQGS